MGTTIYQIYLCLKCERGDYFESLDDLDEHFKGAHGGNKELRADSFVEQKVSREGEDTVIPGEKGEEEAAEAGLKKADTLIPKEQGEEEAVAKADTVIPKEKDKEEDVAEPKKPDTVGGKEKGKGKAAVAGVGSKKAGRNKRKVRQSTLGRYMCFTCNTGDHGLEWYGAT